MPQAGFVIEQLAPGVPLLLPPLVINSREDDTALPGQRTGLRAAALFVTNGNIINLLCDN